jgi:hypothetical protein
MLFTRRRLLGTILAAAAASVTRLGRSQAQGTPPRPPKPARPVKKTRWIGHY